MNALLRVVAWVLAVTLVGLPVAAVLNGWIAGSRWPMRHLVITGEFHQVSDARVRSTVLPYVQNGFFAVDLPKVRGALARLAWVQSVDVRKRWPDRLEVSLVEYKPLARWGKGRMLSENGELFPAPMGMDARVPRAQDAQERPMGAVSRLPLFEGPDARAAELMAFHSQAKPLFLGGGLQVTDVRLSARGSWSLTLSDATEIEVGRGDPQLRLARFARMLPRLESADPRQLQRADLRYTNGFALTWRAPPVSSPLVPAIQEIHEPQG